MRRSVVETKSSGFTEINTTPLIDVSLVLVVILLLATPLAMESGIAVKTRPQSGRTAEQDEEVKRLELTILNEQTVRVNRQNVSMASLGSTIRPMIQNSPDQLVVVRCVDGVTHGAFVSVLDEAKLCGAAHIAIVEK